MTAPPAAFLTIATPDYAAQSRLLARSIRQHHPGCAVYAVVVDRDPHASLFGPDFTACVTPADLGIPTLADMRFRYTTAELCFALKPWAMRYVLDQAHSPAVVYLDSDILLFSPMAEVLAALASGADVVLTPHLLASQTDGHHVDEAALLRSGTMNAGFVAASAAPQGRDFLRWWADRLLAGGTHDPEAGTYGDQKWLDQASAMVDGVHVLRAPGCNVAYWNAHQRGIHRDGAIWMAGAQPLRFFHFSRWSVATTPPAAYHRAEFAAGTEAVLPLLAAYHRAVNGEPAAPAPAADDATPAVVRQAYARLVAPQPGQQAEIAAHAARCLNAPDPRHRDGALTVLHAHIHDRRPDLRHRFDLAELDGRVGYLRWLAQDGAAELGLDGPWIAPAHQTLRDHQDAAQAQAARAEALIRQHQPPPRAIPAPISAPSTPTPPSIDLVSTWRQQCGIATYAEHLFATAALRGCLRRVFARGIHDDATDAPPAAVLPTPELLRPWDYDEAGIGRLLGALAHGSQHGRADVLWLQHHSGFLPPLAMARLARALQAERYPVTAVTLHNTRETMALGGCGWIGSFDRVFVHTQADAALLRDAGLGDAVVVPHGIPPSQPALPRRAGAPFTIGTTGFLNSPKNIPLLLRAVALASRVIPDLRLRLLTCVRADDAAQIERARVESLVELYGLGGRVELAFDYRPEAAILTALGDCDLLAFVYADSLESASGAARLALAADRPLLLSRSPVLADLAPVAHVLRSTAPEDIADAIILLSAHNELRHLFDAPRRALAAAAGFEAVAECYRQHLRQALAAEAATGKALQCAS